MKKSFKIAHWLIFLLFLSLVCSAFSANFFFSKKQIIDSFSYSFDALGLSVPLSDQIFIARVERRFAWAVHFWEGVIFFALMIYNFFQVKKRLFNTFVFLMAVTLFFSGLILYIRIYIDIDIHIQTIARFIHFYTAWIFSFSIIAHIFYMIKKESSKKGTISNMFHFNMVFFIIFLLSNTLKADDRFYHLAKEYLSGKKGAIEVKKSIKNCPYERCNQLATTINANVKTIIVKKPNIKKAIYYLKKSFKEYKNLNSAKLLYKELKKRIDYRSKIADSYVKELGEKELGMSYKEYFLLAKEALLFLKEHNDCYGVFEYASWYYHGYFGEKRDKNIAKKYFIKTKEVCKQKSIFYKMAKNRLKKI